MLKLSARTFQRDLCACSTDPPGKCVDISWRDPHSREYFDQHFPFVSTASNPTTQAAV